MKSPAGPGQPRRQTAAKKPVRLDLRRAAPPPPPEDELDRHQTSGFWKWFGIVALFHLLVLVGFLIFHRSSPAPVPPPQFISLLPAGETVKGTPGAQAAPKVGVTTPAPAVHHHHHEEPTPPRPQPVVTPPPVAAQTPPQPVEPKPVVKSNAPALVAHQEKPAKPKPKIKVDLTLADGPTPVHEKPVKPKHIVKKSHPAPSEDNDDQPDQETADTMGLSKEQIAARLGQKLDSPGTRHAVNSGVTGSHDSHANEFADFYASIHDQFMDKWQDPNISDPTAVDPIVTIHVEKDGQVPADRVVLAHSSGNPTIDDSALQAARSLGHLLQPLPDGCPPDISITLKLIR